MQLDKFLFVYRNTPHATTGVSPAELFLKRNRLDFLHASVQTQVTEKQTKQKMYHDRGSRYCQFEQGQTVLVKNLRGLPKWLPGKMIERTGPLSYRVQVQGQIWRRHTDQLLATGEYPRRDRKVTERLICDY